MAVERFNNSYIQNKLAYQPINTRPKTVQISNNSYVQYNLSKDICIVFLTLILGDINQPIFFLGGGVAIFPPYLKSKFV